MPNDNSEIGIRPRTQSPLKTQMKRLSVPTNENTFLRSNNDYLRNEKKYKKNRLSRVIKVLSAKPKEKLHSKSIFALFYFWNYELCRGVGVEKGSVYPPISGTQPMTWLSTRLSERQITNLFSGTVAIEKGCRPLLSAKSGFFFISFRKVLFPCVTFFSPPVEKWVYLYTSE